MMGKPACDTSTALDWMIELSEQTGMQVSVKADSTDEEKLADR
jgi:hypothetical protein